MSLLDVLRIRDAVHEICAAIDAGEVHPTELEMLALGKLVDRYAGPLRHDLLVMLASRCKNGRDALKDIAH